MGAIPVRREKEREDQGDNGRSRLSLVREEAPAENSLHPSRIQNLQSIEGD
jgi:hypothetical protein